ncbi:MAG: hypothetical protein NVSMB33_16610 [Ktedonobacteraceae bacterium]
MRLFGEKLASNALFGVILGGVLAAVVGVIVTALLLSIFHAIAPHNSNVGIYSTGEDFVDYTLGIIPLHNLFRDTLQLFLVMHGTGFHTEYLYGGTSAPSYTYSFVSPLNGLLIIPALLLIFGGYIAASSDFQNTIRASLWRGVAIAIPYVILLFLMSFQANGCIPFNGTSTTDLTCSVSSSSTSSYSVFTIDNLTLFGFGLLWAALFGLLGASLKIARGNWRHMLFSSLRASSRPQIMGMVVGGLAAAGLGIFLALLVLFSFIPYTTYSIPLLARAMCYNTGDWQILTLWSIAQGPLHAVNLFFLSMGAPINISNPQHGQCFYINGTSASISLFGTDLPLATWTRLLLALPVISLFLGGRVSASVGRAQGIGPAAVQGAMIALPFSALMALLTALCTIRITTISSNGASSNLTPSIVQTAGAGVFELLLWTLLGGALLGALGGMYQSSTLKTSAGRFFTSLLLPLELLSKLGYAIFDRLSGQSRGSPRSRARSLLYGAFLCTLLLVIVAGVAGGLLIAFNQTISLVDNQRIRDVMSVILIALPGLLIVSTCASALCRDPLIEQHSDISVRTTHGL